MDRLWCRGVQLHKIDMPSRLSKKKDFFVVAPEEKRARETKYEKYEPRKYSRNYVRGIWNSHSRERGFKVGFVGSELHLRHFSDMNLSAWFQYECFSPLGRCPWFVREGQSIMMPR